MGKTRGLREIRRKQEIQGEDRRENTGGVGTIRKYQGMPENARKYWKVSENIGK
jgi:hypothetical protein